jgi:hypothetical protein
LLRTKWTYDLDNEYQRFCAHAAAERALAAARQTRMIRRPVPRAMRSMGRIAVQAGDVLREPAVESGGCHDLQHDVRASRSWT